jgi:hypothetical protein
MLNRFNSKDLLEKLSKSKIFHFINVEKDKLILSVTFLIISISFLNVLIKLTKFISTNPLNFWGANYSYINLPSTIQYIGLFSTLVFFSYFFKKISFYLMTALTLTILFATGSAIHIFYAILFIVGCFGIGNLIFVKLKFVFTNFESWVYYSIFTGLVLNSFLIWILMHFSLNVLLVYRFILFTEVIIAIILAILFYKNHQFKNINFDLFNFNNLILFSFAIITLILTIDGTYGADSMVKHLYAPKANFMGNWTFTPFFIPSLDIAIIPQSSFAYVYALSGEGAVRILNWLLLILNIHFFTSQLEFLFNKFIGITVGLIIMATPFISWLLNSIFIDIFNFMASVAITIAIFSFLFSNNQNHRKIYLFYALISVSSALLFKQQSIYLVLPITPLIIWYFFKNKYFDQINLYLMAICIGLVPLIFVLGYNYYLSGNPLFPFYNHFFKSKFFDLYNFKDTRWSYSSNIFNFFKEISFNTHFFAETRRFHFGFIFYVFQTLPLLLLIKKSSIHQSRNRILIVLLISIVSLFLWNKITGPYIRYFISIIPFLTATLAILIYNLYINLKNYLKKIIILQLLVLTFAGFIFQANGPHNTTFSLPSIFSKNINTLSDQNPSKIAFDQISKIAGFSKKILLISNHINPYYFSNNPLESVNWYWTQNSLLLNSVKNEVQFIDVFLHKRKFDIIAISLIDLDLIPYYNLLVPKLKTLYKDDHYIFLELPKISSDFPISSVKN